MKFFFNFTPKKWEGVEPDSLRVMQSSLHRYLIEKGSSKNIFKNQAFVKSRKILEGKAKLLREQGIGKKRNASSALETKDEEILWTAGKLGDSSSTSLVRPMWFLCTHHFGLRGCQEHCSMRVEYFVFYNDISYEYLKRNEANFFVT